MGYSKNPERVKVVETYLNQMVQSGHELRWKSINPHSLAYKIREAMRIAEKQKIAPYEKLRAMYLIKNLGTMVAAVRKIEAMEEAAGATLTLSGVETLEGIIGAIVMHKSFEMVFPDCELSEDDAKKLYTYAAPLGYHLVVGETTVTVTKHDPGEAEWKPE